MINVTDTIKEACEISTTQYDKIVLDNEEYVINNVELDDDCYDEGNIFGTAIAKTLSFETDSTINLEGKEFKYYTGIKTVVGTEWVCLGTFIIQDVEPNDTKKITKVNAMDYMLKSNIEYVSELDYSTNTVTILQVLQEACNKAGFTLGTFDFPNSDFIVDSNQFEPGTLIRQVISAVAQISGSVAKIKNDDKLYLITPKTNGTVRKVFKLSDYSEIEIKRATHPINLVSLGMSDIEGENVVMRDEESISQNGENSLILNDNPFAYTEAKRQQLITAIFNAVKGFEYKSYSLVGQCIPYLEVLDNIQLEDFDGNVYNSFLFRFYNKSPNGLESEMSAPSLTDATVKYQNVAGAVQIAKRTEYIVNKQEQIITQRIESVETTADEALDNTDILDEFIEQKEVQIEAAESSLQNVEIFGESTQEARSSKNLLKHYYDKGFSYTSNGITFKINEDYSVTINGTATDNAFFNLNNVEGYYTPISEGKTYTAYTGVANEGLSFVLKTLDNTLLIYLTNATQKSYLSTYTGNTSMYLRVTSGYTLNNLIVYPMLVEGTEITEYEPYWESPSVDYPSPITNIINTINYKTTGKNIFDGEMELGSINWQNGEFEDNTNCIRSKNYIDVTAGEFYAFSNSRNYTHNVYCYNKNKQFISAESVANNTSYKIPVNIKYIRFRTTQGNVENNLDTDFQIEKGSTVTSFELYKEKTTTITLPQGVELCGKDNFQDSIDSNGVITKKLRILKFDGTENWIFNNTYNCFSLYMNGEVINKNFFPISNYFVEKAVANLQTEYGMYSRWSGNLFIGFPNATLEEFKSWLVEKNAEGEPLEILIQSENPSTYELNETEKLKLQNLETFEGINNITTNATLSAEYFRNIDLNKAFETKTSATNKYTEIKSTTDTIKNTVAETNSYVDNTVMSKIVATEQSIEGLKISLQQTGGQNLIKNSTLKFGLSKNVITTGTVTVEEYTEIQNNTVSKSAIKINAGNVIYEPCDVKEGNMYTFSCLVNKLELANASITVTNVLDNKIDVVAEAEKFVEIGYTFVALSSKVQIKLESDTNYTLFSDCMLSAGAERKAWQLASGEISNKGVNINDDGAEFFNSDVNTKLTISSSGTNIINTETGEVRTKFNADDTLVNNLTVEGISRHGRLIHTDFGTHITTSWSDN